MTRAQMKTLLRKWMRDGASVDFADSELEEMLNTAYGLVQKEIVKVNTTWHTAFDTLPTTAGTSWYPVPPTFGIKAVSIKGSATATVYTKLTKAVVDDIEGLVTGTQKYCLEGQWIGIFPAPTVSVADGLSIRHLPIYALATDAESPKIKSVLHICIALWAKLLLLGETEEPTTETKDRLKEIMGDLPFWYQQVVDEADRLQVVL